METQRVYEVDRKEKEADLAQKDQLLKRTTAAQNRKAMEDKRKNEDYKRKVQLETERKMAESTSRSSRELRERDDKLSRLKVEWSSFVLSLKACLQGILDKTSTRGNHVSGTTPKKGTFKVPATAARRGDTVSLLCISRFRLFGVVF